MKLVNDMKQSKKKEMASLVRKGSRHLNSHGRLARTKQFIQHKDTSVYAHVHSVAYTSLWLNEFFHLKADPNKLVRASLLHDYFLYDWHDKDHEHPRPHGFLHPKIALENAREDFDLHPKEEDAILRHMFPLTLIPPKHREGWIVTIADKICAVKESFKKKKKKKAIA